MSHFYHFNHRILLKRQAPKKDEETTKKNVALARVALKSIDRARALIECENTKYCNILLLLLLVFFLWYALG